MRRAFALLAWEWCLRVELFVMSPAALVPLLAVGKAESVQVFDGRLGGLPAVLEICESAI